MLVSTGWPSATISWSTGRQRMIIPGVLSLYALSPGNLAGFAAARFRPSTLHQGVCRWYAWSADIGSTWLNLTRPGWSIRLFQETNTWGHTYCWELRVGVPIADDLHVGTSCLFVGYSSLLTRGNQYRPSSTSMKYNSPIPVWTLDKQSTITIVCHYYQPLVAIN